MERPSLSKLPAEIKQYIEQLETRLAIIDNNADVEMYVAINSKLSELATEIGGLTISMLKSNKDDVLFERFLDLLVKSKAVSENMNYFRSKLTPDQIKKRTDAAAEEHIFNAGFDVL